MKFVDVKDGEWEIQIQELPETDIHILRSGNLVKVIGIRATTSRREFYGCGVVPWMHSKNLSTTDMRKDKNDSMYKMREYKKTIASRLLTQQNQSGTSSDLGIVDPMGKCPMMPVVQRLIRVQQ